MATRSNKKLGLNLVVGLLWLSVMLGLAPVPGQAQGETSWSKPVNLSAQTKNAWFPDITVDGQGKAHVVFLGSDFESEKGSPSWEKYDKDYYQMIGANGVPGPGGPFNIAASPFGWVARTSVVADNSRNTLHMLFRARNSLYYQRAPLDKASQAQSWSEPRNLDDNGSTYYSDIAVDHKGSLHAVWTEVRGTDITNLHQTVIYRRSDDMGLSWSFPKIIAEPRFASTRVVLKVDSQDGLHLSWDDGYDNQTARFTSTFGGYSRSLDGGKTWSAPLTLGSEREPIAQVVSTPFGKNSVMIAYRVLKEQRVDYVISNDRGGTWNSPATVPGITAKNFIGQHQFDRYYLTADGKGRVHLAAVAQVGEIPKGQVEKEGELGVYYVVWENGSWSKPDLLPQPPGFAEYPRIGLGPDRIFVVWFNRDKIVDEDEKYIWFSSRPYDTGLVPQPITQILPPTPVSTKIVPTAAPTPVAILPPVEDKAVRPWLSDGYLTALASLVPVALVSGLLVFVTLWRVRRKR